MALDGEILIAPIVLWTRGVGLSDPRARAIDTHRVVQADLPLQIGPQGMPERAEGRILGWLRTPHVGSQRAPPQHPASGARGARLFSGRREVAWLHYTPLVR
jgi:hypothetical protein